MEDQIGYDFKSAVTTLLHHMSAGWWSRDFIRVQIWGEPQIGETKAMSTYVVVNRDRQGKLVVKIVEAESRMSAVESRYDELAGFNQSEYLPAPEIVAVSNALPSEYGTGAAYLHAVKVIPPTPIRPNHRIEGISLRKL